MFRELKLSTKLMTLTIGIIFTFSALLLWIYPIVTQSVKNAKYLKSKQLVETAFSIVKTFSDHVKTNTLSESEAKERAADAIAALSYGNNDYFWINDLGPRMVMHPQKPELNGTDLSEFKDSKGKNLFIEMVRICKSAGEGFVEYSWAKPGKTAPEPKISYVKLLSDWGWIIGTGVYINDLDVIEQELAKKIGYTIVTALVITFLAIIISFFIAKSISRPLNQLSKTVATSSFTVAAAASQVSATSHSLSQGAIEQAASLEETSAAIEQISATIQQNADHADQADHLMTDTSHVITQANRFMGELTTSMKEISKASEDTFNIIKTIDEIAFQTNLLALNAAVEAARAGDAGNGFAVVADEVRSLALGAAEAAKHIANMIEGTVKKVEYGSGLVTNTNKAFGQVSESSTQIAALVSEIAIASSEQAQGIQQVNTAVMEMEKVTQQNATNAEESACSSEELNTQASQMKSVVKELSALINGRTNGDTANSIHHNLLTKPDISPREIRCN